MRESNEFEPAVAARLPAISADNVERRRLDHFFTGTRGRLLRVIAPSGYGKTSLVARWVSTDRRVVRWVDLDHGDDDPVTFFETIRLALTGLFEISVPSVAQARAGDPYVKSLEEGLSTSTRPTPFVLVFDDVDRLRSLGCHRLVQTVVERMPADSTVVVVGRGYHDHGTIGRLRLSPGVIDVAVDDLALDDSESYRLLDGMGVDPATPDIAQVLRDLEGWPAGVRLAGQVMRSSSSVYRVDDHVSLIDYLRGEWTGRLDEGDRLFLREIACLERFTGEKCDEVLGRTGSSELLRRLNRDQVVVFALDQRDEWFRMHRLLHRWLSAELKGIDPHRWTQIHLNAARYWEARGGIDQAVQHATAAGDLAVLESIVAVHAGQYFTIGRDATVERWLEAFPPDYARNSPALCGLQCIKALHLGDELRAVEWLRVLDEAVAAGVGAGENPAKWWAHVLHAALDERPAADLIPIVAEARRHLAGGPWSGFACWTHGALCFLNGDLDGCREALRAGVFEAELMGSQLVVAHCMATMSIVNDCLGDEDSAAKTALEAKSAITSSGGELLPPTAPAMAVAALQYARGGDRDAAMLSVAVARQALTGFRTIAPWLNVITRLELVRTALLLDDRATARELMQEIGYHTRIEPAPPESAEFGAIPAAQELSARVEAMHVPATGASALTDAEFRVLRLLPTNLSLGSIGAELFLSRNTVKSHVAAIYRKLDARGRAEAVEQAKAAGLLSPTQTP